MSSNYTREIIDYDWSETKVVSILKKQGYKVFKNGWPDLLVLKDGQWEFVELKGPTDKLKPHQRRMHKQLRKMGLKVTTKYYRYPSVNF